MSVNIIGLQSLIAKEIIRFLKVYNQTIVAPVINGLIYYTIFVLAVNDHNKLISGIEFKYFISSGIIIMGAMQQSFSNTSSTLVASRVMGTFIDYIMPPFSPSELILSVTIAAVFRGLIVSLITYLTFFLLIGMPIYNIAIATMFLILSSITLALIGVLICFFAENFEQMQAVNNYFITPFSFLSGTFYSVHHLPWFFHKLCYFNPFFYMIDGFRYGITGLHETNITHGILIILTSIIAIYSFCYYGFKTGYKIKN